MGRRRRNVCESIGEEVMLALMMIAKIPRDHKKEDV